MSMTTINPRLAIIVGHTAASQGAMSVYPLQETEYIYNTKIGALAVDYGRTKGIEIETFFRDHVGIVGAYALATRFRPTAIIELHFNSFYSPKVRGTEALLESPTELEIALAEQLLKRTYVIFKRWDTRSKRGIKVLEEGARGYFNVSREKTIPSILMEPFFGSNEEDCQLASLHKVDYAVNLVQAFEDIFCRKVG